jgi:arabinofuranan 3-O-arabinosyltransferase
VLEPSVSDQADAGESGDAAHADASDRQDNQGPRHAATKVGESRWWLSLAFAVALTAVIPDSYGKQVFDTKTDLQTNPRSVLTGLLNLWDPRGWFGTIRNQRAGYAFPTAPLFIIGNAARVPPWLTERIWMAIAVAAAFWGMVRLLEAMEIGGRASRLLAAAAYALWPTFSILVGSNTGSILPEMLIPWVLVPLVKGSRRGSTLRAAALSGVAVLFMGGINAANTLDALIVPAIYLLTRPRSRRRNSLIGWWVVAVGLATAWWVIPLVFLGGYGFNFLPYVEQSITTTSTMSAMTVLQGTGDWTAYLANGFLNQAGTTVTTSPYVLVASALVAALGVFGLARNDLPEKRFLRWTFGIGVVAAIAGYWGKLGGPFSFVLRPLLNGPLVPFRNVYKIGPTVTVVLLIAAVHVLHTYWSRPRRSRWEVSAAAVMATAALAGLATPYIVGRIVPGNAYTGFPRYWYGLSHWLQKESPRTAALVLPSSAHAEYTWGGTVDNPLESISTSPWVDREVTPFGGAATERLLDAIDEAVLTGLPAPGLPTLLSRSGVRYVVAQNDLEWHLFGDPSPVDIQQFLLTEGFRMVASFGNRFNTQPGILNPTLPVAYVGKTPITPKMWPIMVYALPRSVAVANPVSVYPVSTAALVTGGPEATLQLLDQGALQADQAAVLAGDWHGDFAGALFAITDTLRRTQTYFGLTNDNYDYTYTATQKYVVPPHQGGGVQPPAQMLPFPGVQNETVTQFLGASSVTASSDGSWYQALPESDPSNVFAPNEPSGWTAASPYGSVGQWIQISFDKPTSVQGASVALIKGTGHPTPTQLRVTTNRGSVLDNVRATTESQHLGAPTGPATFLRITFARVKGQAIGGLNAGLRSVTIPHVTVQPYLRPPEAAEGFDAPAVTFSFQDQQVTPTSFLRQEPEPIMAREFTTPRPMTFEVVGEAMPERSGLLDDLLGSSKQLLVAASSTLGNLPTFRPQNLFDGQAGTSWVADTQTAKISMIWHVKTKLDKLKIEFASDVVPASRPDEVILTSSDGTRKLPVPATASAFATLTFATLDTDNLYVTLVGSGSDPVGLDELSFPALSRYTIPSEPPVAQSFTAGCRYGPTITVDKTVYQTSVQGTYGDLEDLKPLTLVLCTRSADLTLPSGTHHLLSAPGRFPPGISAVQTPSHSPFDVDWLTLSTPNEVSNLPIRTVSLKAWGDDDRTLSIGPGAASYVEMHQNYDAGWVATLGGKWLQPIELDGWQQGFVVPAGAGGLVDMTFAPAKAYLAGLAVGAAGVVVLVVLASGMVRRRRRRSAEHEASPASDDEVSAGSGSHEQLMTMAGIGIVTVAIAICGGVIAVAVPVLVAVKWRWPRVVPWLAGACVIAGGVISAVNPGSGAADPVGSFSAAAQVLALIAVAAVLVPTIRFGGADKNVTTDTTLETPVVLQP